MPMYRKMKDYKSVKKKQKSIEMVKGPQLAQLKEIILLIACYLTNDDTFIYCPIGA